MTDAGQHPRIAAIPCEYKGLQFRSLLEARWAIAFDLLGLQWTYEPVELGGVEPGTGYIADFLVQAQVYSRHAVPGPTLVEVRPVVARDQYREVINKIARSGWTRSAAVLGACPVTSDTPFGRETVIGYAHPVVSSRHAEPSSNEWFPVGYHRTRALFGMGGDDLERLWNESTRRSRWMPPK